MKTFKFRGVDRIVGNVKQPSLEGQAIQAAKGFFHELFSYENPRHAMSAMNPSVVDYLTASKASCETMLGNGPDATLPPGIGPVGDCVIAADLHGCGSRASNAGKLFVPATVDALAAYGAITGWSATDPSTDQGTDPLALVAWRLAGNAYPDGSALLDAINVDARNDRAIRQAIWLATGCLAWASLPDAWESLEDAGDTWDVAGDPVPSNGHGFWLLDYNLIGPRVVTWGEIVQLTWRAAEKYLLPSAGGGCLALLDADSVSSITQKTPAGFDLSAVKSYLESLVK